ncbi:MAG: response regulator transcription factor [Coriobacteriales bacterium]
MGELFVIYTLVIIGVCLCCATMSRAAWCASHNDTHRYVMGAALFYLADCLLVFMEDSFGYGVSGDLAAFSIPHPLGRTLISAGVLSCVWQVICEYLDVQDRTTRVLPGAAYALLCLLIAALPASPASQMAFYSLRQVFLVCAAVFTTYKYAALQSASRKKGMRCMAWLLALTLGMVAANLAENAVSILMDSPLVTGPGGDEQPFVSEHSVSENVLVLFYGIYATHGASRSISARYGATPQTAINDVAAMQLDRSFPRFAARYQLTSREQDALRLLLQGFDNQNIASALCVAPGTVKSHLNRIYAKTGVKTRQELKELFWSS